MIGRTAAGACVLLAALSGASGFAAAGAPPASRSGVLPAPVLPASHLPAPDVPPVAAPHQSAIAGNRTAGKMSGPAQQGSVQAATVKPIWTKRTMAIIDVLNKEDGAVTRLKLPVGTAVTRGHLRLTVGACVVRPPTMAPDAALYLTVRTRRTVTAGGSSTPPTPVFHGWLIRSEPGATVVDDAAVTVRLIGCTGA